MILEDRQHCILLEAKTSVEKEGAQNKVVRMPQREKMCKPVNCTKWHAFDMTSAVGPR